MVGPTKKIEAAIGHRPRHNKRVITLADWGQRVRSPSHQIEPVQKEASRDPSPQVHRRDSGDPKPNRACVTREPCYIQIKYRKQELTGLVGQTAEAATGARSPAFGQLCG
jgi:hypothetical protein